MSERRTEASTTAIVLVGQRRRGRGRLGTAAWLRVVFGLVTLAAGCLEASPADEAPRDASSLPLDASAAIDAALVVDAASTLDAQTSPEGTVDGFVNDAGAADDAAAEAATDAATALAKPYASAPDASSDPPDLSGLPDFGPGDCPASPAPNYELGEGETCQVGEWEVRGDLRTRSGVSSRPVECVQTADVPTDGAAFADFVRDNYDQGPFSTFYTEDPPNFERRTTCAYGLAYFASDTSLAGELHLRWDYVVR